MAACQQRQTEGDNWGITAGEFFFFFFSPPAWVRRAAMEAKCRIKFTPLQTCLSLSPMLCGEGVKSVWRQFKVLSHLTVSQTYLPLVVWVFFFLLSVSSMNKSGQNEVKSKWDEERPLKRSEQQSVRGQTDSQYHFYLIWFFFWMKFFIFSKLRLRGTCSVKSAS